MKKTVFDKMSDSYDSFHLKDSDISVGDKTITVSPKIKLAFGWSVFVLCCVLGYALLNSSIGAPKELTQEEKAAVLDEDVALDEEHDTIVPYEKDVDDDLNAFIESYYEAIKKCDYIALQDMVTDPSEFRSDADLKKKAEYVTDYTNITVYTKVGLDEGSYIAYVVSNMTIVGVNSSPYDINMLYIVNGARGYLINNGTLSLDTQEYMEKVKGDKDIQKVYKAVEKKNTELMKEDSSLQVFFDIITKRDIEVDAAADYLPSEGTTEESTQSSEEETTTEGEADAEGSSDEVGETEGEES